MKKMLSLLLSSIVSLAAIAAGLDQEAITKLQELMDVQRVGVGTEDEEFVIAHPEESIFVFEPALEHSNVKVRQRSLYLLAILPEHGSDYVVRTLRLADQDFRVWAIRVGMEFHPYQPEVARAFVEQLEQSKSPSELGDWLGYTRAVDPSLFPERERLRTLLQEVAVGIDQGVADRLAVLMLGKYRDTQSRATLLRLATGNSGTGTEQIDYTKLSVSLCIALAMVEDQQAINDVARRLGDKSPSGPSADVLGLVSKNIKHLGHNRQIQSALYELVQDTTHLEEEARKHTGSIDYVTEEQLRIRKIHTAARSLAASLSVPATNDPKGRMDKDDLIRIKSAAATRLGLTPTRSPNSSPH